MVELWGGGPELLRREVRSQV